MASYLDKENINTAIVDSTHLDLSHVHITTANFMQLQPIYNKEMVPGEKIDVNVETFSRMNPMPVPTYGRCNIKNRAYFVPFRTVFRGWNDFITDAPHHNSMNNVEVPSVLLQSVPTVTNKVLMDAMLSVQYQYGAGSNSSQSGKWDYALTRSNQALGYDVKDASGNFYKFTCVGRQVNKILESLGYKINYNAADTTVFSALPLLCWAKVYIDWYFPSAYTNAAEYSYLSLLCNADTGVAMTLDKTDVGRILQMCYTCYDSDYFVSAWDKPNEPISGTYSDFTFYNIDTANNIYGLSTANYNSIKPGYVTNNSGNANGDIRLGQADAPFISPYTSAVNSQTGSASYLATPISQYLLHGLHALTDYFKRNQLAGSRAMDRYLARFGKALPAEKLNRSVYLGSQIVPVQFGDVMSTADTANASVGDYAGKGMAYGQNGNFTFSTNEYGMFIIVSTIAPATGYYQGIDRTVKHVSKLDFWTPEFDSLGAQPITADELYVTREADSSLGLADIHDSIFGFTPRYAEYKIGRDQVTGNFRIPTLNGDISTNNGTASWHLMRSFDDSDFMTYDASGNPVGPRISQIKHNINFVYSRGDIGQYNRIFFDSSDTAADNFTIIHNFNIGDYAPMKPLYDNYEFEDKGKEVRLDVNGVKHN